MVADRTTKGTQVNVHWFGVTVFNNLAAVAGLVLDVLIGERLEVADDWAKHFVNSGFGARRYKAIYLGPYGINIYAYPLVGEHCHVEIKGEALELIGGARFFEFLEALQEMDCEGRSGDRHFPGLVLKWRAARVDLAIDGAPFTPAQCRDAWLRGDVRCPANRDSQKWFSNSEGDTFYFGSRASGRIVRVYNRRGPTRVEIESKGKWAKLVGMALRNVDVNGGLPNLTFGYLRQFVDFVDAGGGGSISRAPLLPWWEEFVGNIPKADLRPPKEGVTSQTLTRAKAYLERMLPTLYVLKHGLNISLDEMAESASKLTEKHIHRAAELRRMVGG